jgi:hypothetical protein
MIQLLTSLATHAPTIIVVAFIVYLALIAICTVTALVSRKPARRRTAVAVLTALLPWK